MKSRKPAPALEESKIKRCAIYTRKSNEEGLNKEHNTLHAQRERAENYILSQSDSGWRIIPENYDDGGFSGGNIERPALKRMMDDIQNGRIDIVVVYKVDRISRSLMDFYDLLKIFEKHGVEFVSVTQNFDTSQPMGKLMLNIQRMMDDARITDFGFEELRKQIKDFDGYGVMFSAPSVTTSSSVRWIYRKPATQTGWIFTMSRSGASRMRWKPLLKQAARQESKENTMNQRMQERVDAYYSGKEQIVATLMQIANHLHNPPPAERKTPEQIIPPDITRLKQAHMKLREMADILGIETQALEI